MSALFESPSLPESVLWSLARRAGVRASTVRAYLRGRIVSAFARRRIDEAARRMGL